MNAINSSVLDRYITGNYGEDQFPDEPIRLRCFSCKAFLSDKPDKTETWEDKNTDKDGKEYILMSGVTEYRRCLRCDKENKNNIC